MWISLNKVKIPVFEMLQFMTKNCENVSMFKNKN